MCLRTLPRKFCGVHAGRLQRIPQADLPRRDEPRLAGTLQVRDADLSKIIEGDGIVQGV